MRFVAALVLLWAVSLTARAQPLPPPPVLEDESTVTEPLDDVLPERDEQGGWVIVASAGPRRYVTSPPEDESCGYEQDVVVERAGVRREARLHVRCIAGVGRLEPGTPSLELGAVTADSTVDPAARDDDDAGASAGRARGERAQEWDAPSGRDEEAAPALGAIETAGIQAGVGLGVAAGATACGTATVLAALFLGSNVCGSSAASLGACVAVALPVCGGPFLIGAVETWVANALTGKDVGLLGPVLASYGGLAIGLASSAVASFIAIALASSGLLSGSLGTACVCGGCVLVGGLLVCPVVLLPALVYSAVGGGVVPEVVQMLKADADAPLAPPARSLAMAY